MFEFELLFELLELLELLELFELLELPDDVLGEPFDGVELAGVP